MPGKMSLLYLLLAVVAPGVLIAIRQSGLHQLDEHGFAPPTSMMVFSLIAIRAKFQSRADGQELFLFRPLSLQEYLLAHVVVLGIVSSIVVALYQQYGVTRRFRHLFYAICLLIFIAALIEVFLLIPNLEIYRTVEF